MNHATQKETDRIAQARVEFLSDLRATFGSPAGARVLAYLRQSAGHGKPAFLPTASGAICPFASASRDGRKSIIDEIDANLAIPADAGISSAPKAIGRSGA
ncbi:MAG: hypothetical protein WCK77_14160 [Verrucomicrobiota bacterium]